MGLSSDTDWAAARVGVMAIARAIELVKTGDISTPLFNDHEQQSDMTQRTDRTIATSEGRHNALGTAASCQRFVPRAGLEACVRGFVVRRVEGAADSEHLSR